MSTGYTNTGYTKNAVALISGANKGIGKEIARGLARLGHTVLLGARDEQRGRDAAGELSSDGDVRFRRLDVTDEASIAKTVAAIEAEFGGLDVLVNNAGITPDMSTPPSETPLSAMREVYEVNVFGVVALTNALLPLLRRSSAGRVVNVSSGMGSLAFNSAPDTTRPLVLSYTSSKSALNALTVQYARELRDTGIKVNSIAPGKCATDLNGHGSDRSAAQGARIAVELATVDSAGPTGGYFSDDGAVPW